MGNGFAFLAAALEEITLWLLLGTIDYRDKVKSWLGIVFIIVIAGITTVTNQFNVQYHFVYLLIIMIILVKLLTGRRWLESITDVITANVVFLAYQFVMTIVIGAIWGNVFEKLHLMIIFLCVAIVLAIILYRSEIVDNFLEKYYRSNRKLIIVILINLIVLCAFIIHVWDDNNFEFWNSRRELVVLAITYVIANIILLILVYQYSKRKQQLVQSRAYADHLNHIAEELFRRDHEYKNHLSVIIAMAKYSSGNSLERISNYCEQLIDKLANEKHETLISDNINIASFIKYQIEKAESLEIKFEYYIERPYPEYRIPDYDMVELLSNLINNAIEACENLSDSEKKISVLMESHKIRVVNSIGTEYDFNSVSKIGNAGFTTKGQGHGYGIRNIKAICKKYSLNYEIYIENKNFVTEIII